jgi:hypothetical protein
MFLHFISLRNEEGEREKNTLLGRRIVRITIFKGKTENVRALKVPRQGPFILLAVLCLKGQNFEKRKR